MPMADNTHTTPSRRYMSLESFAPLSNTPVIKLPGVAA